MEAIADTKYLAQRRGQLYRAEKPMREARILLTLLDEESVGVEPANPNGEHQNIEDFGGAGTLIMTLEELRKFSSDVADAVTRDGRATAIVGIKPRRDT
jgi:hypothetical protein